ncbi:MAG: helix-turn-helix domain-containing protein [Desulfovibrio sp.]|nr:helix-turn-helix domain-containing protein [Desulfovibrio sp.]
MNFDELGAALRTERERRGLRIEDVADHLKISARHLRALEEGDAAALPHPAYARGFIRSYAAFLGMSPDEIHNALNGVASHEAAPQAPVHMAEPAPRGQRNGRGSGGSSGGGKGALIIFLLLLVGAGAYAGWQWGLPLLSGLEKPRLAQPSPPLSSAQPAPVAEAGKMQASGPAAEKARAAQPAPSPAPAASTQRQDEPRVAASQTGGRAATAPEQQTAQASASSASPAAQAQAGGATPSPAVREEAPAQAASAAGTGAAAASGEEAAATPGQHKVIITATEECWIHSNADKTDTRQFSLRKGDTFALTFARSLELKLGNAGGVRIRYDGQAMPPAGQSGQVRTVTFPPQDAR